MVTKVPCILPRLGVACIPIYITGTQANVG
uniref:Uncharacterized protein n=1 Tax=Anguilla anguilla TaxID=7936 RepID=A0A0E9PK03_ANGAN